MNTSLAVNTILIAVTLPLSSHASQANELHIPPAQLAYNSIDFGFKINAPEINGLDITDTAALLINSEQLTKNAKKLELLAWNFGFCGSLVFWSNQNLNQYLVRTRLNISCDFKNEDSLIKTAKNAVKNNSINTLTPQPSQGKNL